MAEATAQERTEKATPKRRQEARKKGQVAVSREIPSALILITVLGVFYFAGSWIFWNMARFFSMIYQNIGSLPLEKPSDAGILSLEIFGHLFSILTLFFLPILVAGIAGNVFQVGFQMHGESMSLDFTKLDPIAGFKKMFSLRSLVELVKSILKIVVIGAIAYAVVRKEVPSFPMLVQQGIGDIFVFVARVAFRISFYVCLVLLVMAALDYFYQRWQFEQNIKMTKQEVRDERKQTEGDPKVKARIRSMQMEIAKRRMMEAVPTADVVITNPTRLAIALKYDADQMIAPRILAKGAGHIAERIRDIARRHRVPIVENKPLAQTLYQTLDIGDFIPAELYRAVAEVLAYVYRLKSMHGFS